MSTTTRRSLFEFPNPVNEVAARTVAAGVVVLTALTLVTRWWVILVVLPLGFIARVASGPRFSPLGLLATRVVAPRLEDHAKLVAGPPKRFAQAVGAAFTTSAAIAHFGFGADGLALGLLGVILVFATLESVFAICAGCIVFGWLMRAGVIPDDVCADCNDIWARRERLERLEQVGA